MARFNELFDLQASVVDAISADYPQLRPGLPLGNAWEYRILNLGYVPSKRHCDVTDLGFTLVMVLGDFEEHFTCLPELGVKVRVRPGSLVALPSSYYDHFVSEVTGVDRFSIVFTSVRPTAERLKLIEKDVFELDFIQPVDY